MTAIFARLLLLGQAQASMYDVLWPRADTIAANCTHYTVQAGDTCFSVGAKENVTFSQLLAWNPDINTVCSNLGNLTGASICISNPGGNFAIPSNSHAISTVTTPAPIPSPTPAGTNSYCGKYHYVKAGEDCSKVTEKFSIALSDFLFLNSDVWTNCTNLLADEYYCVQPVGSIKTYPGYGGTGTTTAPFNQTSATALPNVGDVLANYTSSSPAIPIANDTRVDCFSYLVLDNITENSAADCWSLTNVYGVSAEDFVLWNPSLADSNSVSSVDFPPATTTASGLVAKANPYAYPCTLSANASYCVELMSPTIGPPATATSKPPSPRAANESSDCTRWFPAEEGDTCEAFLGSFALNFDQFFTMNPSIKSDCTGLAQGTYYCVSTPTIPGDGYTITTSAPSTPATSRPSMATTPSPVQSGMVGGCKRFYDVQPGDGCWAIANQYGIALDDFYAWNPAVGTDCHDLESDVYVCVGTTAAAAPTPTPTTATISPTKTTGGVVVTPTPTQSGMVSGCGKFYRVQTGDGCWAIANEYDITTDDLYRWNLGLDECRSLWPDYYVCVRLLE